MANFDNLPSARPPKPSPARDAPTAPRPSKSKFEFSSPEDTPPGAKYTLTETGFKASASASTLIMSVLLGLSVLGLAYFLWQASKVEGTAMSFFIFIGAVAAVMFVFFLYFALGRVQVETVKGKLVISKTIFGIGFPRKFDLLKIERMRIKNRRGERALGWGIGGSGEVKDQVCEIETDKEIRIFAAHLREKHLYYMRYLIVNRIKELKGTDGSIKF